MPKSSPVNLEDHPPSTSTVFSDPATEPVKKSEYEANTAADSLADKSKTPLQHDLNLPIPNPDASGASAKSELHKICAAYKWKPPCFECCKQEGPPHSRLFSFKVTVEIIGGGENGGTVLECFGEPKPKKTAAAEHAAQGALWYFHHFGYFPVKKSRKRGKPKTNPHHSY